MRGDLPSIALHTSFVQTIPLQAVLPVLWHTVLPCASSLAPLSLPSFSIPLPLLRQFLFLLSQFLFLLVCLNSSLGNVGNMFLRHATFGVTHMDGTRSFLFKLLKAGATVKSP